MLFRSEGKPPTYLCGGAPLLIARAHGQYTDDMQNLVALEDYKGPGVVVVEVTNIGFLKFDLPSLPMSAADTAPWVSTSGRSIPYLSIGGLTFTMYQGTMALTRDTRWRARHRHSNLVAVFKFWLCFHLQIAAQGRRTEPPTPNFGAGLGATQNSLRCDRAPHSTKGRASREIGRAHV